MKMLNQVKITFAGRSVNEGFARAALAAFLVQLDPTVPQLADIKTAVSEAVTNCIVHAYPDKIGAITLTAAIYEGGVVRITITDRGVGIPDIAKAMEPMFTTGDAEERAGLGFADVYKRQDQHLAGGVGGSRVVAVQAGLADLDIPVAVDFPDEVLDLLGGQAQLVLVEVCGGLGLSLIHIWPGGAGELFLWAEQQG